MLSNAEVFSYSLSWTRFHFLLKTTSMIYKELAFATETETCSGSSTLCQPLEKAVLTADHTSECPVYFSATPRAELNEEVVWEKQG